MENFKRKVTERRGEFTRAHRSASVFVSSWCRLNCCVWRARAALRPRPRLFGNESKTCHSIWKYFCIDL